jgi:hypothetical protein
MKYTSQLFVKIAIDSVFIRLNSYPFFYTGWCGSAAATAHIFSGVKTYQCNML